MQAIDFTFDTTNQYTFWSGIIGGLFLQLSYFGTDQSQVQRYLTAKSVDAARQSLLMSAFWKIPLQVLVLIVGVLMFAYFLFQPAPMLFKTTHMAAIQASPRAAEYSALEQEFTQAEATRKTAAEAIAVSRSAGASEAELAATEATFVQADQTVRGVRARAKTLVGEVTGDTAYTDTNYIFPTFVTQHLPIAAFSREESHEFVHAWSAQNRTTVSDGMVALLASISRGNPFYLTELAAHVGHGGDPDQTPSTILDLIGAQCRVLSKAAHRVLVVIAVLESRATTARVTRVLEQPASDFMAALDELEEAGLVTTQGPAIRVRHRLVDEVRDRWRCRAWWTLPMVGRSRCWVPADATLGGATR
jgi:hypothetical protein